MNIYEQRQMTKQLNEWAREAAQRKFPEARVTAASTVHPVDDGAFVEISVWISADELAAVKPPPPGTLTGHARTCRAYGNYQPPYEDCTCGFEKEGK